FECCGDNGCLHSFPTRRSSDLERLMDILTLMRQYRLEPKRLRFVYPKAGKEANTILIEGIKNGNSGLKALPPLFVYDMKNEYTPDRKSTRLNSSHVKISYAVFC